jgi:glycosyltransferase involved in cell wall biosynthesis
LLVPAADAQALALVIARLAAEPAIRRRMGKAARSWALRHGDVGQMAVAYAGLYDSSGATPGASVMLEQP